MADLTFQFGADEAMVLLEWLVDHTDDELDHPGTRQALWNLEATFKPLVDELFAPDYTERLERAVARLTPADRRSAEQRQLVADHPSPTASNPTLGLTTDEATVLAGWLDHGGPPQPDVPSVLAALSRLRQRISEQLPPGTRTDLDRARERLDWGQALRQ